MRSRIAVIAVGVAAAAGCAERDGSKLASTSLQTSIAEERLDGRPASLVGTWRQGERHCLVFHGDGRAVRTAGGNSVSGTWRVCHDGIVAIPFSKDYRIDGDSVLVDVETNPRDRDLPWKRVGEIKYFAHYAEGCPDRCPSLLVGTWRWPRSSQGKYDHLVLHRDGRAVRDKGGIRVSGTWHVRDDGILASSFTMKFRIDGNTELMDVETIHTDHDFPWRKTSEVEYSDVY